MSQHTKRLQGTLARRYLGKRGIHGISIDEANATVKVYVDRAESADQTLKKLRRDAGALKVEMIASPRARLV